jgi:hypothetical protein
MNNALDLWLLWRSMNLESAGVDHLTALEVALWEWNGGAGIDRLLSTDCKEPASVAQTKD